MASSTNNMSPQQKEKLLQILECKHYKEFAKVKVCKSKLEIDEFWSRVAAVLNSLRPGPSKLAHIWKKSWMDIVRYTVKQARVRARIKDNQQGDLLAIEYTMDNPTCDRIMCLDDDLDKENNSDPLWMAPRMGKRSLSPTSPQPLVETNDPLHLIPKMGRRSSSPFNNTGESSRRSPYEQPSSPLSTFDINVSSPVESHHRREAPRCVCDCKTQILAMKEALQNNTKAIENLAAQVQINLGNLMVLNVDENVPVEVEDPSEGALGNQEPDILDEYLNQE